MAPIPENSPIRSSTDAWASLVANVGPLLALVGEKHVKLYLKSASRLSHHLLFSVGSIGIITTLTTYIRMAGGKTVKRLINRQFETREEVLLDVTGASDGLVGYQLMDGRLQQAADFAIAENDRAMFYVKSRFEGSVEEARVNSEVCSQSLKREFSDCVCATCLRFYDEDVDKIRKALAGFTASEESGPHYLRDPQYWIYLDLQRLGTSGDNSSKQPVAMNFHCGHTYGISLACTAAESDDWMDLMRYFLTAICVALIVGLIVTNWFRQKDPQGTGLMVAGLFLSAAGNMIICIHVTGSGKRKDIPLDGLSNIEAGFFSKTDLQGVRLNFVPKRLMRAHESQYRSGTIHTSKAHAVIVLVAISYLALYLGLRTAEWWICLCMLLVFAAASVGRVILLPDSSTLLERNVHPRNHAMPFDHLYSHIDHCPFLFSDEQQINIFYPAGPVERCLEPPKTAGNLKQVVAPKTYDVLFYDGIQLLGPTDTELTSSQSSTTFLRIVFTVVKDLRDSQLAPAELSNRSLQLGNPELEENAKARASVLCDYPPQILHTDRLHPNGVFRIPLDIAVQPLSPPRPEWNNPGTSLYSLCVPFNLWLWRYRQHTVSLKGKGLPIHETETLCRLTDIDVAPGITIDEPDWMQYEDGQCCGNGPDHFAENMLQLDLIWMAVKMAYVVWRNWPDSSFENLIQTIPEDQIPESFYTPLNEKDVLEEFIGKMRDEGLIQRRESF